MVYGKAQGLGKGGPFFFGTRVDPGEYRSDSRFIVVPALEDFKGPFHVLHFVAAVHHGHEHRLIGLFAGGTGDVRKSGGQVHEDIPENALCHVDEAGHAVHGHRFRQVRLRRATEDRQVIPHLDEVGLQRHR